MQSIGQEQLAALNSATKYPSIPTHHELAPNGTLLESGNPFAEHDGPVLVTEKVDGTNARLICIDDDWFIGSREDLLAANGDRIYRPDHRIVEALLPYSSMWIDTEYKIYVYYIEVYGNRKLPGYKIYGDGQQLGLRHFDTAEIPLNILDQPVEQIAAWRGAGGQKWDTWPLWILGPAGIPPVEPVPVLHTFDKGSDVPTTIEEMHQFLKDIAPTTKVSVSEDTGQRPEGIVLRTTDRSIITKARYQSYDRTKLLAGGGR